MKKRLLSIIFIISIILSTTYITGANLALAADESVYSGNIQGGGFETEDDLSLWTVRNQNDQTVAIDTAVTHNNSNGALAIDIPTDYYGKTTVINFRGKTATDTEFNIETKYSVEMYIKTSEDFSGSVYMRIYQNGQYIQSGSSLDMFLLGSKTEGGGAYTDWTKIKTSNFSVDNSAIQILLYVNGTGKIWIDDINIAENKNILENGGFDDGLYLWENWSTAGEGRTYEITNTETCASAGALKLTVDKEVGGLLYMVRHFQPDVTKKYTLSLDVKCENVALGDAFVRIYQYYDVDGVTNRKFLNCYGSDNVLTTGGTTDWQHFNVKLSGWEPTLTGVVVFVYLQNGGTVYYDNISIAEVEKPNVAAGEVKADINSGTVEPMTNISLFAADGYDIYYTVDGTNPKNSSTAYLYNANYGIYISENTTIKACAVSDGVVGEVFNFNYICDIDSAIVVEDFDSEESIPNHTGASYDNGALKLDLTTAVYPPQRTWAGIMFTLPVDNDLLDANTVYNISARVRTENLTADTYVDFFAEASTTINGVTAKVKVNANTAEQHNFLGEGHVKGTNDIPTDWTEIIAGYKGVTTTIPAVGNDLSLTIKFWSSVKSGTVWIDDIKLIPVKSSQIEGGIVYVTGTDENGNTVYTATAAEGFKVGTISAKTCNAVIKAYAQTVNEISRTDSKVVFTVSHEGESFLYDRYLTVNFEGSGNADTKTAIIEDDILWDNIQSASYVSLDTSTKCKGSNSIKITGSSSKRYTTTGDMNVDSNFDYKLEFYVKTQNISNPEKAFVNVFMTGHGSVQNELDGRYGAYVKTKNIISGIKSTQDWTRYELIIDDLDGFWPTLEIAAGILGSTGTLYIDGVNLTALPYKYYPLTVSGNGKVFGNAYYKKTLENFTLNQGFYISNNTYNTEVAEVVYKVYNDADTSNSIKEGSINVTLDKAEKKEYEINLDVCNKYGTYTIEFYAENTRGYSYYAGFIKVAVIKDASDISNSIFGINGAATNFFDNYKKTGVTMLRSDLFWGDCEAVEGVLDVPESLENLANYSIEHDIDQMFIINGGRVPSWYDTEGNNNFPRSDKQIAQFINFTKMVVEHFKGRVKYYEFFNEADWIGSVKVDAATYGKVLKEFYKAVKEVDPNAYVVAGATSLWHYDWAAEVFSTAGDSMDYWAIHPYANPDSPENKSWFQNLEGMQALARERTGRTIPFLLDELGWSNNESSGGANESDQLKWFIRLLAFAQSADYVEKVAIYNDFCGGTQNKYVQELRWGIFSTPYASSGYAKPCVAGISNYAFMTDGYDFEKRIELSDGLYIFKYTSDKKDKDLYVIWTNDVEYRAKIINSTKNAEVFDIFGNSLKESVLDYMSCQKIGGNPIYLTLEKGEDIKKIEFLTDNDIIGDANSDNNVNILDFIALQKHLSDKSINVKTINVDYNGTEIVDLEDLISLRKQLLGLACFK